MERDAGVKPRQPQAGDCITIIAAGGRPVGLYMPSTSRMLTGTALCIARTGGLGASSGWTGCMWRSAASSASPGCPSGSRGSPPWPWRLRVGAWPTSTGCIQAPPSALTGPRPELGFQQSTSAQTYAHVYIDDTGGVAPKDLVLRSAWPRWLQEVDLGEEARPEDGLLETSAAAGPWPVRPWQAAVVIANVTLTVARARYPLGHRWGTAAVPHLGPAGRPAAGAEIWLRYGCLDIWL